MKPFLFAFLGFLLSGLLLVGLSFFSLVGDRLGEYKLEVCPDGDGGRGGESQAQSGNRYILNYYG